MGLVAGGAVPGFAATAQTPSVPTRGFNLPGWVDRETGSRPAHSVLEKLHRLGFRTIRLPVAADTIVGRDARSGTDMLRQIHAAVAELNGIGFGVIVDLHPDGEFMEALRNDPQAGGLEAAAAWNLLADMIADLPPASVYAELLNEPPLGQAVWLDLRGRLAETVRAKCPDHTIVWGPARYQGIWEIADTPPLADRNSIAAVHYYTPMGFTHQCENWDNSPVGRLKGLPFPAKRGAPQVKKLVAELTQAGDERALDFLNGEFEHPWNVAQISADFAQIGDWSKKHDCPVILDEFGALGFCSDPASRANWVRAVRQAAEANGVGWTYWEFDHGFGFIENRQSTEGFDLSMIDALLA